MARVKRAVHGKKRRRTVLERAQGFYGNKSRSYRAANEQVMHSLQYAYRDRRARKGDFRKLWIQRINAAARLNGTTYSRFIAGLHRAESKSTGRCSPISPSATHRRSQLSWRSPSAALDEEGGDDRRRTIVSTGSMGSITIVRQARPR